MKSHPDCNTRNAFLASLTLATAMVTGCASGRSTEQNANMSQVSGAAVISGTATYRERIALPPGAVFEAVLEDVSRADAPAVEIGRTTLTQPPQPPIRFSITYDPARIDANRSYSVRARILADGKLRFSSDMAHPVITRGAGRTVDIVMRMVQAPGGGGDSNRLMGGEMTYMADAGRFTDCMTSQSHPIAMEGDFTRMQRAYLDGVSNAGAPLYVTFEGVAPRKGMEEGSPSVPTVVVSSFVAAWPTQTCERARAHTALSNAYWRIILLDGQPVDPPTEGRREAHLILKDSDGKQSYTATVGCSQLLGAYSSTGARITFTPGVTTRMACIPPLDAVERRLSQALTRARRWEIHANTLVLRDDAGARLAVFEVVHR